MKLLIVSAVAALTATPAAAQGITLGSGKAKEYPYPAEPQYQYPMTDAHGQARAKCPKGQALFQGKCRIVRRVD